jgi:hypothetical protein
LRLLCVARILLSYMSVLVSKGYKDDHNGSIKGEVGSVAWSKSSTHHSFGCSHLDCSQHCILPGEIGCSHLAVRTEDIHSPGRLARYSSFGIRPDRIRLRIVGSSGLVERFVLPAGKNSRPDGNCLLVEDYCSNSFDASAVRDSPPARQGHLPKS